MLRTPKKSDLYESWTEIVAVRNDAYYAGQETGGTTGPEPGATIRRESQDRTE